MRTGHERLLAESGWKLLDTGSDTTTKNMGISVREDNTQLSTWNVTDKSGNGHNMLTYFGISGKNLLTADPALIVPQAWRGGSHTITISAGSVNILREG